MDRIAKREELWIKGIFCTVHSPSKSTKFMLGFQSLIMAYSNKIKRELRNTRPGNIPINDENFCFAPYTYMM